MRWTQLKTSDNRVLTWEGRLANLLEAIAARNEHHPLRAVFVDVLNCRRTSGCGHAQLPSADFSLRPCSASSASRS